MENSEVIRLIPDCPGSYIVAGQIKDPLRLHHDKWKGMFLSPGSYFYCGSARGPGGLQARIRRHLNRNASKFWHFDYIKPYLRICQIWWICSDMSLECGFVNALLSIPGARTPLKGFGAGDCTHQCSAHLVWFQQEDSTNTIYKLLLEKDWQLKRVLLE